MADCQSGKLRVVVVKRSVRLAVRNEIAPLVAWLCAETMRRGYPLRTGQCWGFACRAIRGTSTPSNHSWGLAVDLNSLANPMGPRLVTDMPDWMPRLWKNHGFRWGGTYSSRKDAMHYEYMLTPRAAKATARRLEPVGSKRAAKPAPGRRKAPRRAAARPPRGSRCRPGTTTASTTGRRPAMTAPVPRTGTMCSDSSAG